MSGEQIQLAGEVLVAWAIIRVVRDIGQHHWRRACLWGINALAGAAIVWEGLR